MPALPFYFLILKYCLSITLNYIAMLNNVQFKVTDGRAHVMEKFELIL